MCSSDLRSRRRGIGIAGGCGNHACGRRCHGRALGGHRRSEGLQPARRIRQRFRLCGHERHRRLLNCVLSRLCECRDFSDGSRPPSSFPPCRREKSMRPKGRYIAAYSLLGRDATAPQHLLHCRKVETNWRADVAWLPRLAGRCARNDLGTDPLRETDDASSQALTLASFARDLRRVRLNALMHRNRRQGLSATFVAASHFFPKAEFHGLTPFGG